MRTSLLPLLALSLASCSTLRPAAGPASRSGQEREYAPLRPGPRAWLEPANLATAARHVRLRLVVDNLGAPVDPSLLQALAAALVLTPAAPVEVSIHNPAPLDPFLDTGEKGEGGEWRDRPVRSTDERAYVELRPLQALAEGWHTLQLSAVPGGLTLSGPSAVRFHTGSRPLLLGARICRKASGVHAAYFQFSEEVAAATAADTMLYLEQDSARSEALKGSGFKRGVIMGQRADGFSEALRWRVVLRQGLVSPEGVPVETPAGATTLDEAVELAALPSPEPGCRLWRAK